MQQTYTPTLKVKRNGVPILSKNDIDTIGENFVRDFQPEALDNPSPIDIDSFVELYLGMTPAFQYLSHNGIYLGMTVFNDTNAVPVFDPSTKTLNLTYTARKGSVFTLESDYAVKRLTDNSRDSQIVQEQNILSLPVTPGKHEVKVIFK